MAKRVWKSTPVGTKALANRAMLSLKPDLSALYALADAALSPPSGAGGDTVGSKGSCTEPELDDPPPCPTALDEDRRSLPKPGTECRHLLR